MRIEIFGTFLLCVAECAAVIMLNDMSGVFESPAYPAPYGDDLDMTWKISAPPGFQVLIYFSVFDLEDSYDEELGGSCVYDFIEVEHLGKRQRYCGNSVFHPYDAPKKGQQFRSEGNETTIRFVTDYSNEEPLPLGFKAHYVIEDKDECAQMQYEVRNTFEDWDELIYCNHFCHNIPGSYYCSCRPGFELHENQHTCAAKCQNEVITSDSGEVASPDYPEPYSKLTDCDWMIEVRKGLSLNIRFDNDTFDIEDHPDYTECVYDWVQLTKGDTKTQFCGQTAPYNGEWIDTNTRVIRLDFHTDLAVEKAGFKMYFTTNRIRCLEDRVAPSNGKITNTNSKSYYEFEDVITFACDRGYSLVGENEITCRNDGIWSAESPTCRIKSCGRPTELENVAYSEIVDIDNLAFTYGDVARVKCQKWYKRMSGAPEWVCSEDAIWTSTDNSTTDLPVCKPRCGEKNHVMREMFLRSHAFGGDPAMRNEYPWMVFINIGPHPDITPSGRFCGGALISPKYVLTAAHCLTFNKYDFEPDGEVYPTHVFVWLGAHNREEDEGGSTHARSVGVADVIRHPDFNRATQNFDVALLELKETITMNDYIRPICIPRTQQEFNLLKNGTAGYVAGWGLNLQFRPAIVLQVVKLPVVNTTYCVDRIAQSAQAANATIGSFNVTNNHFCAGYSHGQLISTCGGDSGGSWMLSKGMNKFYSFGLVSFGISATKCGVSATYTAFTKVPQFVDWILDNTDLE
ncbi:mannan-binding lectin serine protease 1-like [Clavelina lepadiformis]|uniref:mannan-binding lectin serine protease 1-like n=1 Tax=Clavelina lepadiformis TaxID=159417 RepID=UPI004041C939